MGDYIPKNTTRIELRGVDELGNRLIKLERVVRRQVVLGAMKDAADVFLGPLSDATPVSKHKSRRARPSGTTRDATGYVIRNYQGGLIQAAFLGHRYPEGAAAHLSEKGTAQRKTVAGHNRGRVVARHWFRAVYAVYRRPMQETLRNSLTARIEAATRQIGGDA